jgi:hypothetical protein
LRGHAGACGQQQSGGGGQTCQQEVCSFHVKSPANYDVLYVALKG